MVVQNVQINGKEKEKEKKGKNCNEKFSERDVKKNQHRPNQMRIESKKKIHGKKFHVPNIILQSVRQFPIMLH